MDRGHPQLAAARATTRAAEYDLLTAGLWSNPQLNVQYSRSLGFTSYDPVLGYAQLGVTQVIETSGLPGARREAAEHALAASRADELNVRLGLVLDVHAAFVQLAAAEARLEIHRETAAQLERADQIVHARVAAGAAPHYDASRIDVAMADARAAVGAAEADVVAARAALDVAVGPEAVTLRGRPAFELRHAPPLSTLVALAELMRASRPDLVAARQRARAAVAQVEVARRSVLQGVSLYAGVAVGQSFGPSNERQVDLSVGLTVPLPLLDRGQGAVPSAELRAQSAGATAGALQLAAEQRLAAAYAEVARRRQALAAYEQSGVAQSQGMRREAEAAYREGRLSVLELVDAYLSVRDARLRLVSLASEARTAEVGLWRAAGVAPRE
jgi:cobalt-zinc-cadmium efflux system outer membrane protein